MQTTCAVWRGNDIYIVDNAGDIVNESLAGSTGIDTVQSSISFSLSNTAQVLGHGGELDAARQRSDRWHGKRSRQHHRRQCRRKRPEWRRRATTGSWAEAATIPSWAARG